jgi:hypothetical protein
VKCNFLKKIRPSKRLDRPGYRFLPVRLRFTRFFSGSFAWRFYALTGPDICSVSGSTGSTDRSGPILITLIRSLVFLTNLRSLIKELIKIEVMLTNVPGTLVKDIKEVTFVLEI